MLSPLTWASGVLGHPAVYIAFQRLVGGAAAREAGLQALAPRAGERVLDVGCGPAYYLDRLPSCEYHGFDTDRRYVEWARQRFGHRASFHAEEYGEAHRQALPKFDAVMLMGLLHHLDDAAAGGLLDLVARSLAPGGRVVTLDTVHFQGQSTFSRWLADHDRGEHVRPERASSSSLCKASMSASRGSRRHPLSRRRTCSWCCALHASPV